MLSVQSVANAWNFFFVSLAENYLLRGFLIVKAGVEITFTCIFILFLLASPTEYNEVFKVNIDRKNRSLGRIFKRQPLKLEVKYER